KKLYKKYLPKVQLEYEPFVDWLVTFGLGNNRGSREVIIGTYDFSTTYRYVGTQGGAQVVFGQDFKVNTEFTVTPLGLAQYAFVSAPGYAEANTPAALNVIGVTQNSLILGLGAKLSLNGYDSWITGTRAIRAMLLYNTLSPTQISTAAFECGGSDFSYSSTPSRLGLRLGADFAIEVDENLLLQVSYDLVLGRKYVDNAGMIKLKYFFDDCKFLKRLYNFYK
ncbi:MAG TPA: autotransporter outer membrane beta-barrel domain-containing protein, partial [Gammaproteobacteria bacterium]|nr:autotransporter outer membrane beta-barrel domain-containing protein [Gammaproteobacteria bacterium]